MRAQRCSWTTTITAVKRRTCPAGVTASTEGVVVLMVRAWAYFFVSCCFYLSAGR